MSAEKRLKLLGTLSDSRTRGHAITGIGVGNVASAIEADPAGADFLAVTYLLDREYKRGPMSAFLAYDNANDAACQAGYKVLAAFPRLPVLMGVFATDSFLDMEDYLRQIAETGYAGIINYPSVGIVDGKFRTNLEKAGISYDKEVELIQSARQRGLLCAAMVFNEQQALRMIRAGADLLVYCSWLAKNGRSDRQRHLKNIRQSIKAENPAVILLDSPAPTLTAEAEDREVPESADGRFYLHY